MKGCPLKQERGNSKAKMLDRWLGPVILRGLALFHRVRTQPAKPKRLGILMTAAIGDTLLGSSLGRSLKALDPNSEIVLITGASNLGIGQMIEGFDQVVAIPVYRPWAALRALRRLKLDVLVDTGQWACINAIYSALSRARFTIGFQTPGFKRHFAYDVVVPHSNQVHELENFQALLKCFSPPLHPPAMKAHPCEVVDPKLVVCHLKPSGEKTYLKEWAEENWQALIDELGQKGVRVYLSGGPEDASFLQSFRQKLAKPELVEVGAGRDRLEQTLQVLERARLVISVNTGIMHLASILGRPLIALHGPTNPKRWGPLNENAVVIQSSLACAPCLNLGFDYGCDEPKCMRSISLFEVLAAVQKIV